METPSFSGGEPDQWVCEPPLPSGLTLGQDGSISGIPDQVGSTNHTITGSNNGGSAYASLNITTIHASPDSIDYGGESFTFSIGQPVSLSPSSSGGQITAWSVNPDLLSGLSISQSGVISGIPSVLQPTTEYTITAENSGGSVSASILIEVIDLPIWDLEYSQQSFDLSVGE